MDERAAFTADAGAFINALSTLTERTLRTTAVSIRAASTSPADDVTWWRAALAVEDALRHSGRSRVAAVAAHAASVAVMDAARQAGVRLPDTDVTCVARAAGHLARALAAGPEVAEHIVYLAQPWGEVAPPARTHRVVA